MFFLKVHAGRSKIVYAFLQYLDCTLLLESIDKGLGRACLRRSTTDEINYNRREDDNPKVSVGEWYGVKPSSTNHAVVHIVRSNYSVNPFCNASASLY